MASGQSSGQKVALFGFSYKKNTSDTRSTPSVTLVSSLNSKGFRVSVHDPQVTEGGFRFEMEAQGCKLPERSESENGFSVDFCGSDYLKACADADCIVVATEWDQFKDYDYSQLRKVMGPKATIYDFRCYLDRGKMCDSFDRVFQLGSGWLKK